MRTPLTDAAGAAALVVARVQAAAAPGAVVEPYGSCVYAPSHASDVDVLVSDDDATRLATALGLTAIPTVPPRIHGTLDGIPVDLTVVCGDDELARTMRAGPRDAAALVTRLATSGRTPAFTATWPHVRRFVHARALGHNGLGWFGSFGWAVLLAAPLIADPGLREIASGSVFAAWLRWLATLTPGAVVSLDELRRDGAEPFQLLAPTPPTRDVARLSKRTADVLFAEARAAATAVDGAVTDDEAVARIQDLDQAPPPGTTLQITGDDDHGRGRYEGAARGILRELEKLGAVRSWGRLVLDDDGGWRHRITVPAHRGRTATTTIRDALALAMIDADVTST